MLYVVQFSGKKYIFRHLVCIKQMQRRASLLQFHMKAVFHILSIYLNSILNKVPVGCSG